MMISQPTHLVMSKRQQATLRSCMLFGAIVALLIVTCSCQECSNENLRPEPRVLVNGESVIIEEPTFSKHGGSYPPNSDSQGDGASFFVLHEKPVLYVTDFLNQTMAEELKSFCIDGGRFVRSNIGGYGSSAQKHDFRTSESCTLIPAVAYLANPRFQAMIQEDPIDPQVAKIAREVDVSMDIAERAAKLLNVEADVVEPLQLVRYTTPEAQYKLHHDHGGFYGKATEHRSWTMLIFLNDVSEGGHTSFPKLGLDVVPRAGDAVVWSNTHQSEVDPDMVHMGKPPSAQGIEKYAVNVWFGEASFAKRTTERSTQ